MAKTADSPGPLERGDHTDREVLRFHRIRVERFEVLYADKEPVLCRQGDTLLLSGRGGSLTRSSDGGVGWEPLGSMMNRGAPGGDVRALAALSSGTLLAAVSDEREITICSSTDHGEEWKTAGTIPFKAADGKGGFVELRDKSLLFSLGGRVFRSTDGGAVWSQIASLPDGWMELHPLVLSSGKLVAAVCCERSRVEDDREGDPRQPGSGGGSLRTTLVTESEDGGKSWKEARQVTRTGQVPGGLIELPDGRLVLSYGEESFPYGARALISADGGGTWGDDVFLLGVDRCGIRAQPRGVKCEPTSSAAGVALVDGTIVSVYDRGRAIPPSMTPGDGRRLDEWCNQTAILVVRWIPEGMEKPPLIYPNLWTETVDANGYLDNGLVRMRPDDRFEGGDYIENYEMVVYRRVAAEQMFFSGKGTKGVVVCRHPDGSLVYSSSRDPSIYRSTDEGRSWEKIAKVPRPGNRPSTFAFGVTAKGTYLLGYNILLKPADPETGALNTRQTRMARSDDGGKSWTDFDLDLGPIRFGGGGDGCRIHELSDGTIVMSCGAVWIDAKRKAGYNGDLLLRSRDDGKTWGDRSVLPPGSSESSFLELPSGELLCATRYQRDILSFDYFDKPGDADEPAAETWPPPSVNLAGRGRYKNEAIMFSQDRGYNWTTPFLVTRLHMVAADVVLLPDNRLVMTYDHKDACGGPRGTVSTDGGKTWGPEIYILAYHTMDARTSSVVLEDGRILTMWAGRDDEGAHGTIWYPAVE